MGVTPLTVRNWDQKGKLVAHRHPMNNYRLYKVEDVESLLKNMDDGQVKLKQNENSKPQAELQNSPKKLRIDVL